MIEVRRKREIFQIRQGWFEGHWHFSFGGDEGFYDPENTSFGTLRVFNIDTLIPGAVWPLHRHRDIEVITYCLDGRFQHGDQRGRGAVLEPGDVQHTTVGREMWHEEVNHSQTEPMTFLQIWVMPRQSGLEPSVEHRKVDRQERLNRFLTLVSERDPGALPIRQDAEFVVAALEPGARASHPLLPGYGAYFYVWKGKVRLNGHEMSDGDAAKVTGEQEIAPEGVEESEVAMVVVQA